MQVNDQDIKLTRTPSMDAAILAVEAAGGKKEEACRHVEFLTLQQLQELSLQFRKLV